MCCIRTNRLNTSWCLIWFCFDLGLLYWTWQGLLVCCPWPDEAKLVQTYSLSDFYPVCLQVKCQRRCSLRSFEQWNTPHVSLLWGTANRLHCTNLLIDQHELECESVYFFVAKNRWFKRIRNTTCFSWLYRGSKYWTYSSVSNLSYELRFIERSIQFKNYIDIVIPRTINWELYDVLGKLVLCSPFVSIHGIDISCSTHCHFWLSANFGRFQTYKMEALKLAPKKVLRQHVLCNCVINELREFLPLHP